MLPLSFYHFVGIKDPACQNSFSWPWDPKKKGINVIKSWTVTVLSHIITFMYTTCYRIRNLFLKIVFPLPYWNLNMFSTF